MQYRLDTGILLRLLNRNDPLHSTTRSAVRRLKEQQHLCITSFQNLCEFWNVCTRPASARGGLGLSFEESHRRLKTIERICALLPDSPATVGRWKELVTLHQIQGVRVHDTRIVALMDVWNVSHLLTLNPVDFACFNQITVVTPEQVLT